jgi:hypothetical protein
VCPQHNVMQQQERGKTVEVTSCSAVVERVILETWRHHTTPVLVRAHHIVHREALATNIVRNVALALPEAEDEMRPPMWAEHQLVWWLFVAVQDDPHACLTFLAAEDQQQQQQQEEEEEEGQPRCCCCSGLVGQVVMKKEKEELRMKDKAELFDALAPCLLDLWARRTEGTFLPSDERQEQGALYAHQAGLRWNHVLRAIACGRARTAAHLVRFVTQLFKWMQ